jgi:hypothetical protein
MESRSIKSLEGSQHPEDDDEATLAATDEKKFIQ